MPAYIRDMEIAVDTTSGIDDTEDSTWMMGNKAAMKDTTDSDQGSKLHTLIGIANGARIDIAPNITKTPGQYLHDFIIMIVLFSAVSVRELCVVMCTIV